MNGLIKVDVRDQDQMLLSAWASKSGARFEEQQSVFHSNKIIPLDPTLHATLLGAKLQKEVIEEEQKKIEIEEEQPESTFNLNLNYDERSARDKAVLPLFKAEKKEVIIEEEKEEEDPDEDLDF